MLKYFAGWNWSLLLDRFETSQIDVFPYKRVFLTEILGNIGYKIVYS